MNRNTIARTYGPIIERMSTYTTDERNNRIHATAIIYEGVELGSNNYIGPYCIIGGPAEKKGEARQGGVRIGSNNVITGHVTIDAGTIRQTWIGNGCYLMKHSHVGHDAIINDEVTLSCHSIVGGWTKVMQGANLGLGAIIHPRHVVGAYAMIGMGAVIPKTKPVRPFGKYVGVGAYIGRNHVAIERARLADDEVRAWEAEYENMI